MAAPRRSNLRNVLTVMGGTFSSRVLGLLRQALFNRFFSSEVTDAFNVAYRVPNLFRELLAEGALTNSIIPVYKSLDAPERKRFASSFLGVLLAVNAIIVGLGIVFAPQIVDVLQAFGRTPGKESSLNVGLAVMLTRIVMPFLAGISFSALAMALLNAEERFAATSFAPLAFNLVTIAGFLFFPGNAVMLGVFTTLGGVAQLLVQLPSLRRHGLMPSLGFASHPALSRALRLMGPFAFTTSTRQFLNVVLTGLLTHFPKGAVTGFSNADTVFQLCLGLFAVSPALASYTRLAEQVVAKDWEAFRATVSSNLRLVLFLTVPVSALLFVLAPAVTTVLFDMFGPIELEKYRFTVQAVPPLALAVVPWGLSAFLVRTFYVRERAQDAIFVTVVGVLLNTALYYALARVGFSAMNAATTIAGWAIVGAYAWLLQRQVGFAWKKLVGHAIKVGMAALVAALVAALIAGWLPAGRGLGLGLVRLVLAGVPALLVYAVLCAVFQVQELEGLRRRLLRR